MATELVLVRHGHAVRVNGHYFNAPLTPLGEKQAALTGRLFCRREERLGGLYCSPLRRARETAARIGVEVGNQSHICHGIQEIERFEVTQLIAFEVLARLGFFGSYLQDNVGKAVRWPIAGRVSKVLSELVATHPDERLVVVMHAGVINAALAWYFPRRRRRWYMHTMDNCSLTRLRINGSKVELMTYDDTDHLRPEITTKQPPAQPAAAAKAAEEAIAPPPPGGTSLRGYKP